ncbi:hypothetical protein N008_21725 (plasmid) [Hymenobacter sp. APR13]|nr:hypothetical protein N008_21725 [Hymenobacter sp. APR13]
MKRLLLLGVGSPVLLEVAARRQGHQLGQSLLDVAHDSAWVAVVEAGGDAHHSLQVFRTSSASAALMRTATSIHTRQQSEQWGEWIGKSTGIE